MSPKLVDFATEPMIYLEKRGSCRSVVIFEDDDLYPIMYIYIYTYCMMYCKFTSRNTMSLVLLIAKQNLTPVACKEPVNNRIDYRPQMVQDSSHEQYT